MPKLLGTSLDVRRCPHCNVDTPNLRFVSECQIPDIDGQRHMWRVYGCTRCGGLVSATAPGPDHEISAYFPSTTDVSAEIPERSRAYLDQAMNSLAAPAGAVMLAASAVDAMLKAKNLVKGTLYERIEEAAAKHLITSEMAQWAHDVRLDANDQRHADEKMPLPGNAQARKCVDFALALAQLLFVLPALVQLGINNANAP